MRITTIGLQRKFMAQLDKYTPKLLTLLRSKGGIAGRKVNDILSGIDQV